MCKAGIGIEAILQAGEPQLGGSHESYIERCNAERESPRIRCTYSAPLTLGFYS